MKNNPELWQNQIPIKTRDSHKYKHGHALIYGAPKLTGATRMAATACARMGAGLVTVIANKETSNIYKTSLPPHIIVRDDINWTDSKVSAKLYGSGGLTVNPDFHSKLPTVLDAEALSNLPEELTSNYILTPHEGEFARAFPNVTGSNIEKATKASKTIKAFIVLKGAETVIASPDGKFIVNDNTAPYLATAGTGDVLAGMITGLLAQDMPTFEACCSAVWIHGECAKIFGKGLVATDIESIIPEVLKSLS